MKRLLVFCLRDWLHPRAGAIERYVHEVFKRIAGQGHHVALVCHSYPLIPIRTAPRPRVEMVDGIQIARLGARVFYRMMVKLFLSRLNRNDKLSSRFDILIDCVNGRPLPLAEYADLPVVPMVFSLHGRVRASEDPPGPVIAASRSAGRQLCRAGVPEKFIVEISPAEDGGSCPSPGERALAESWDMTASLVLATIENL